MSDAAVSAPTPEPEPALVEPIEPEPVATTGLDEMVVTAERRKANLQTTPISIAAVSGEQLRARSAVDLSGVAEATPNMQLITSSQASGGSNFAQVFIRGIGQTDFYITKDPAVGLYIDGVYLARAPGALLSLLDIERVEVLRGPQGTLFGRNTEGGAVSIITKKPDDQAEGVADLRVGTYNQRDISGSFAVPLISNRLFLRATGMALHQDGYYERLQPGPTDAATANGNAVDTQGGRLTLRWTPVDTVDVLVSADVTTQRQTATDYQAISILDTPNILLYKQQIPALPGREPYGPSYIAPRPWTTYSTTPSYDNTDAAGVSGALTWDLGPLQLKFISAYRALRAAARTDADGTPYDIVASNGVRVRQHQISEELQFTGNAFDKHLAWVVGLWYFEEHATEFQASRQLVGLFESLESAMPRSIAPPGQSADMCPADGSGPATCLGGKGNMANARYDVSRDSNRGLLARSYAAFGQASLKATEQLGFTLGARISREEKEFTYFETLPLEDDKVTFDHVKATPGWNVFTPKVGAQFLFTPDLMTYASFSRGFKAGGIPGRPPSPALFKPTDPEWVTAYELGVKSEWLDRRLRVNLALFYSQYTDIQVTRNTTDSQGAFVRLEQNAGDGRLFGFEAEASAAPIQGLMLSAGAGYTNFRFTSLLPQMAAPGMAVLSLKDQLPFTPKLTAVFAASYRISFGSYGSLTPRVDVNYSSGYFTDIGPNTPGIAQDAFLLMNARLAYAPESAKWEAFLAATNLTNQAVVGSGVYGPANGSQIVSYRAPRMMYAGMRFNFD